MKMWRCSRCGKWSHAKRKPKTHERQVSWCTVVLAAGEDSDPHIGDHHDGAVIEDILTSTDVETGYEEESAAVLRCGPFETWEAVKVE